MSKDQSNVAEISQQHYIIYQTIKEHLSIKTSAPFSFARETDVLSFLLIAENDYPTWS